MATAPQELEKHLPHLIRDHGNGDTVPRRGKCNISQKSCPHAAEKDASCANCFVPSLLLSKEQYIT